MTTDTLDLQSNLAQFIGTEQYRFNPLYPWLKYTDGVKYFAENAGGGAYWFLDIIGTEMRSLAHFHRFLTIELLVNDSGNADIFVTDGDDSQLLKRHIGWSDCPPGNWRFFLQGDVQMLTSEY